ncbi:late endosomal/lysosomal adaptor and MAPK and MTOR activator-domain-containing protein [Lophiotrema nucula]|uniref:Late endosomal/lysosomal adaptor and MAPK and MTOR activator-domain-containing protein n=1 Tax=Lophiotrema nucula TaxID=690887 RepID=A0A6A5ZDA7_9PLEO|nr:late endosomal/lysosomal adaptor and MAPK and MTOR activator-domain-containing protein [Lophiotrema nucula]
MGVCSSCLGLGRRPSDSERSDSSHLLGDAYQHNYGSINPGGAHGGPQPDPEEIRRQRDALERICAQASDQLIDVSQATHTDEGSKMASEYPRLFNERFPPSRPQMSRPSSADASGDEDEATWLGNIIGNTNDAEGSWDRVEPIESGALTIHFGEPLRPGR